MLYLFHLVRGTGRLLYIFISNEFRYLAISGQTAIEFWGRRNQQKSKETGILNDKICDFRQESIRANLEYIFGTKNYFKMFLPSFRYLEHEGVEWEKYINTKQF